MEACVFKVVFVLGAPGAGKGTQCQKVEQVTGYRHISAGELLRTTKDKSLKREIEEHLAVASLVPGELMAKLLLEEMKARGGSHFLIDGFPRSFENVEKWEAVVGGRALIQKLIFLNCPQEVCLTRCLNRGPGSGRTDDTKEKLTQRLEHYKEVTVPVIEHFRCNNLSVEIDSNRTPDEVAEDVQRVFESLN